MALIKGKQLANGTITATQLASDSVTTAKIADANITAAKLNISGQAWDLSAASAVSVPAPSADAHAATKGYVDAVKQGLDVKASVRLATAAALENWDPNTTNKTLTAPSVGATSIDGVSIASGNRILVKNQSSGAENGIYVVTTVGDGSTATVLTRADDFNTSEKVTPGAFTFVEEGTANADSGWVLSTNATITLDSTALAFTQFSSAGVVTAGDGLSKNGTTLSVNLAAASGLEFFTGGALRVDTGNGLTFSTNELVVNAGDGLGFDAGALKVNVGNGIEISSDAVQIKVRNSSVGTHADGLQAAVNYVQTEAVGSSLSTDNASTSLTMDATPAGDSFVQVLVNGVMIELGDGVKTKDAYFSADNGSTARAISAIAAGDTLYWNGGIAFTLETTDRIDIIYSKLPQ